MLILTRYPNQSVIIGDNQIRVCVLGTQGKQVRLGFEAVGQISIHREEIFEKIKENERIENGK